MKTIGQFIKKNFAVVWLMAGIGYHLLGESSLSFTMFTLYIIEDICDRIEWGMKANKSNENAKLQKN